MGIYSYPREEAEYDGSEFAMWHSTRTRGVFMLDDNLAVVPDGGMTVKVKTAATGVGAGKAGKAWLDIYPNGGGIVQWIDEDVTIPLQQASGTQDRIDRIIFAHNYTLNSPGGTAQLYCKQGVFSDNPVPPEVVRRYGEVWELSLAQIFIPKGTTEITTANIFDERLDENVCGVMATPEVQIPTRLAYDTIMSLLNQLGESDKITLMLEDRNNPYQCWLRNPGDFNLLKTGF